MVAIDTASGTPVRVGGAALMGGPALSLRPEFGPALRALAGGGGAPGLFGPSGLAEPTGTSGLPAGLPPGMGVRRASGPFAPWQAVDAPEPADTAGTSAIAASRAAQRDALPAVWGSLGYASGALYGPPYELPSETMQWQLSSDTVREFRQADRGARLAQKVHPRGPMLQTAGSFVSALYGVTPTPLYLGVGLDFGA